eukprot:TRINITY_DN46522_c0_g1_i1.p1 TRINITY_DN46522_c0_g1~~TRINITY_DN46522_c0_g1_i1.p1  ORF type:complete len:229 (+),score=57.95 TRINITY_DN46522_c0_g1_i1:72-689(+)
MSSRPPADRMVTCSKAMSRILRHTAAEEGYNMTPDGFVACDELRKKARAPLRTLTDEEILKIVEGNDKQRFKARREGGKLWVAANQGHSKTLGLSEENYLKRVTDPSEAPIAVHGTYSANLEPILATGLSRMQRQHIHFARGLPDSGVISGMRKTADVLIYLDVPKLLASSIPLYKSDNEVLLSPGNSEGFIPPEYFKEVVRRDA